MTWIAALVVVVAFMALISMLGLPARAREVVVRSGQAVADIRSKTLSEVEKEQAVQAHARSLFGSFFVITLLATGSLAVPIGLVALLATADVVDFGGVMDATLSWPILLAATVIGIGMALRPKRQQH